MKINKRGLDFKVIDTPLNRDFWLQNYPYWENETFDFLDRHLCTAKTFIEIGAWIGPLTIYAATKSRNVYCLEPDPIAYAELLENLNLNVINNVTALPVAISNDTAGIKIGSACLGQSGTSTVFSSNAVAVECITLQQLLDNNNIELGPSISCVKIDIEGHEEILLKDKMIFDLPCPLRISFHPGLYKDERQKQYMSNILPFLKYKKITMPLIVPDFFEINC